MLQKPEKIIENCEIYLDSLNERINNNFKNVLTKNSSSFAILCSKLDSLSPLKVLSRGYSIVKQNNDVLTDVHRLKNGDVVTIQFENGTAKAAIIEV